MAMHMDPTHDRVIDELLVMRCQAGSRSAFDLLIRRWHRRLWRYARTLTRCDDAAWDVMQETWLAIVRQIRRLHDPAWFPAWAYRIVRNKSADHARRGGRRQRLNNALIEQRWADEPVSNEASENVGEALQRLPQKARELLMLKYGQARTIAEMAVILGVPAGTVKRRLHDAREMLKRMLQGDK